MKSISVKCTTLILTVQETVEGAIGHACKKLTV